jgi:putative Mn2+ efflux pump MntP
MFSNDQWYNLYANIALIFMWISGWAAGEAWVSYYYKKQPWIGYLILFLIGSFLVLAY